MKKKLLKSLVLVGAMMMFSMSAMAADQLAIDATNFPDEKFRACVATFDTDDVSGLSQSELDAVTEIVLGSMEFDTTGLTDVTGIEPKFLVVCGMI